MLKSTKELIRIVEKRASEQNSWKEAEELLQRGADITAATSTGAMIHSVIAEEQRFRPIIPWKADHCQSLVDVLQKAASDRLATEVFAANGGDVKMMRRLLQLKASCYHSTVYGSLGVLGSLLTQGKVPIRVDVVQFLMESDANAKYSLTTVDDQQHTVLSLAKDNSQCPQAVIDYMQRYFNTILNQVPFVQPDIDPNEIVMWIRQGADIEATDENGNTVLLNAVLVNNLKLTRALVSAGSNTAHRNGVGVTALHIAKNATPKNPPLATILEAQEVNTELKHLIETKNARLTTEDVFALLEKGANINAITANGDSLLHLMIANRGTTEMLTAFVSIFNADIAATNTKGYRPIESCILLDEEPLTYLPTIFKLPKMTADLFTNPRLNKTLLKFAVEQTRFGAAKMIQEELNLRLRNCVTRTHTGEDNYETMVTELDQLTANGAQIDHKYHDQEYRERTVLHHACETGAQRLVKYMVERLQADYTLQNQEGDCPIAIAADFGHLPIVEYLRGLPKSSVNVFNNEKQTPLHLATRKRHVLVVRYLVKWGANHRAQNRMKQTPLDMARTNVSKRREDEMTDQHLIHFLEQLICPPVDSSMQDSPNAMQPDYELDTCELVAPVLVNPIPSSIESTDGALGKLSRGLFSGSPNNSLHEAAKIGSVWEAQKAIGEGADIRYRKANRTPHEAAVACEKEFSRQLNSSMLNSANHLVLERMAVGCQQIAGMIQQIAEKKLVEAIEQSNASLVRAYHVSGAPLIADTLYRACRVSDNVEIVDYLLNESVDAYQAMLNDSSLDSPYRIARKNNFIQLAAYVKYRLSLECTKAVKANNLDMVKRLVSSGASVDMHDTNNLSEALRHENIDLIQFLCAHGAKMPLNWITANSVVLEPALSEDLQPEIVFCLNQCLINRRLRFAAASGDVDGVVQCQHLGADIDSANCHGATALSCAIHYGNFFPIVHALVSSGASLLHSNDDGPISLLDLAVKKNYQQIASYLSKELNILFLSAILNNEGQAVEKLANLGVDFNYQDEQNRTALHYAVQYHGVDLVRWLCEWGSVPTLCDIHGDYPIIQATEKGDYAMVEFFVINYPATKRQTNKAGLTALQIAQQHKFTCIAQLMETETLTPDPSKNREGNSDELKHDHQALVRASRDGHVRIIQEFIDQRYASRERKKQLCYELIQLARNAKQFQIVDILEPYYTAKLKNELASDMELGGGVALNQYHKKILLGFLSGLSDLIADSPIVLDPTDPKTYVDLFSGLNASIAKHSQELQQVASQHDVVELIERDETNTRDQLTKISEQLGQLLESRDALQARIQDTDERLFKQQHLTALQRKEFIKAKESHKQQLATYECSIFLFERQQEATLARRKTIDFIKGNTNLMMFYRTIENQLEALFHSVLAAQGGYLRKGTTPKLGKASPASEMFSMSIPIMSLTSVGIKAVLGPMLSKLDKNEQKKEWQNFSTLGNIEELRRIASDTAGLLALYYREQIQSIDPLQTINSNSCAEMTVVTVAEYVTTWIIDELKLGKQRINPTEPLPHQIWLCVARKDPIKQGKRGRRTQTAAMYTGHQPISLKVKNCFGDYMIVPVQLRYLIGCVSVVGDDGSIYQYSVPADCSDNELTDLELFGYVYVTPFSSDEKTMQSIVEGRKLDLAKRDEHGNVLTRFDDIIEHAQTYAMQQDHEHASKSLITEETANQLADVIREQKIFANSDDVNEEMRKVREAIELNAEILREEIQEKTKFYQLSIDATHEQVKRESEESRATMKRDNDARYEQAREEVNQNLEDMEARLTRLIDNRVSAIGKQLQERTERILILAEAAKVQSLQAISDANQATEISQQMVRQASQVTSSTENLVQWAELRGQEFQSAVENCKASVEQRTVAQQEFCERMVLEMRTTLDRDLERARAAVVESAVDAKESAQFAKESLLNMQDIPRIMKNQLEVHKKEIEKTVAEAKEARQQSERAVAEAREAEKQAKRATTSGATAFEKVNSIHDKVEKALERIEKLTKTLSKSTRDVSTA